ncbi:hypothetical protein AYL99_10305 [Fonsecaea erecta]|uniref:Uncharacterized protein n=1 Tax=Fonsecaea erecta TaxID=1367422 RepID=A0A178Z6K5_9EURO|nr:hypothetical protein AYL99_10305 [Fonsecaea erecta]OAP55332.1 hypothetical protein AYL99_10305 [Fonsecaea erecta]
MRLLEIGPGGKLSFTDDLTTNIPPYAILSHTWGSDKEEVTFRDLIEEKGKDKEGYSKIRFCADRAGKDGLQHFWIDTCCIDKKNLVELSEAIVSMFQWYADAQRCYVFLSDVSAYKRDDTRDNQIWECDFRKSRWFTRGWTLQELLAPSKVDFYSREGVRLGDKSTLGQVISEITGIPETALDGRQTLKDFTHAERLRWASHRETKKTEDGAYCLLGIFDVSMPVIYGEGNRALDRLKDEIAKACRRQLEDIGQDSVPSNSGNFVVRRQGPPANPTEERKLLKRREMVLASLRFKQMDSRRSTIDKAYSTTCQWLLEHPAYLEWNDPRQMHQHHGFFWIKGIPGAGKSTLMKFALAYADQKSSANEIVLSFFFNARGEMMEYSTIGMYRALLFQLLTKMTDLQDLLDGLDGSENQSQSPVWTIERLCELLSAAISRLGRRQVKCFIDALDECDEQQIQEMIDFFEELGETALEHGSQLFICFASRHYPTVIIPYGRQLTLENEGGHTRDLSRYIDSHLRAGKGRMIEEVRTEIRKKANGVFLWVVLVVPILNQEFKRGRIFAVKKKLHEIPAKLSDLFKDILRKDDANMDDLLLCLQWILFAKEPLQVREFYFAMLAGLHPESEYMTVWNSQMIEVDDMNRFVLNSSKGLAQLTRSEPPTVQFIHESVRDFLLKDNGLFELWPDLDDSKDFEGQSHQRLKSCCLNYSNITPASLLSFMNSSAKKMPNEEAERLHRYADQNLPFLRYAVQEVLWHADKAQANGVDQSDFIDTFQLAKWVWLDNLFTHRDHRHNLTVTLLYILAEKNLSNLIRIHPSNLSGFDVEDERYGLPVFAALATGSDQAVRALLKAQADERPTTSPIPNLYEQCYCHGNRPTNFPRDFTFSKRNGPLNAVGKHGDDNFLAFLCALSKFNIEQAGEDRRTPLSWAAGRGHSATVKILLEKGANLECKDKHNETPLSWAAKRGHKEMLRLLLKKGAERDSKDNSGRTPLSRAAEHGHKEVVQILLENGAERDFKDNSGGTPLSWAAERGNKEVVQLLLEKGANPDSKDNGGQTPLLWATVRGHKEVVQLLLEKGADRDSKDNSGRTPLLWATVRGYKEIVQLLLENGADPDFNDNSGRTPLLWATIRGYEEMIQLLLEKGADPDSKDNSGRTPLLWATIRGYREIVQLLLEKGAERDSKDNRGWTPLSWAAEYGRDEVVKLLSSHQKEVQNHGGITQKDPESCDIQYKPDTLNSGQRWSGMGIITSPTENTGQNFF